MWQNIVPSHECFVLLSKYADFKGEWEAGLGLDHDWEDQRWKMSLACRGTLVVALEKILVKMSGSVAVAVAYVGLNKQLDANRSFDLIKTLDKTLLTKCAEVNHLNWICFLLKEKKILGVCNKFEHMAIYPDRKTLNQKTFISQKSEVF